MAERAERTGVTPADRPRPRPNAAQSGTRSVSRGLVRSTPPQPAQVLAATGGAVVAAAKVGRILGRSGWRIARQLPGVNVVEHQAQRIRSLAALELTRLLDVPQQVIGSMSPEEQRVMMLVHTSAADTQPLRSAMGELLDRSTDASRQQSQDYLFGTIVSQLVPDEARIVAALATGKAYAAVDIVARPGGRSGSTHTVLANASTVGAAAGTAIPQNTATYLTRLQGFGLVEFTRRRDGLDTQFDVLLADAAVREARHEAERQGNARTVRKAVTLSRLGRDFWSACAPPQPGRSPGAHPRLRG